MTLSQTRMLGAAVLDDGIQSVNFFNGRLLSGEDLTREQDAQRKARLRLGKTIGEGVAYGLDVSEKQGVKNRETQPVITVGQGLAVNRLGQPLALSDSVDVALTRPSTNGSTTLANGLFADCPKTLQPGKYVSGKGVYLLTIGSASGPDGGRVPVSGLGNIEATCNTRYQTEGVQFRLIQLPIDAKDLDDEAHLRNRVAHRCFGAQDTKVTSFFADPFGPVVEKYGLLDDLRPDCLTDAEVPLAMLFWTSKDGIRFIDHWSVRRRITRPAADTDWLLLLADRRAAEGEAMFLQFQEQSEEMRVKESNLSSIAASARFDYLPAAGLLPVYTGGFDPSVFWGPRLRGYAVMLQSNQWRALLDASFRFEPIAVASGERVYLYSIPENVTAPAGQAVQQYVLFASRPLAEHFSVPFAIRRGGTRFDSIDLADLFRQVSGRYRGLYQKIIGVLTVVSPTDHLGLMAIQHVIGAALGLEERARGQALTQDGAVNAFLSLGNAQQYFTQIYSDVVLKADPQKPYGPAFEIAVAAIDELLKRTKPSVGVTGLFQALNDFDLLAASVTQRAINQYLELQIGALPIGNVDVDEEQVSPLPFKEGDIVDFQFRLRTRADMEETYDLLPVLVADKQQAAWEDVLGFLDAERKSLPKPEVKLLGTDQTLVFVQIKGVPADTDKSKVKLQLTARSKRNPIGLVGTSSAEQYTVGVAEPPQATDIHITYSGSAGAGKLVGGRFLVTSGQSAQVFLDVLFDTPGTYTVEEASITDAGAAGEWLVKRLSQPEYLVTSETLSQKRSARIGIQPLKSDSRNTSVQLRIVDKNNSEHRRTYTLDIGVG